MINYTVAGAIFKNSKAVIIQGYGMGNVPTSNSKFMKLLEDAINEGCIIVIMSQCHQGEVNDVYETGRILINMGAVLAFDMTIECVFAKLAYLMGKGYSNEKVKLMMMSSLKGELTDLK